MVSSATGCGAPIGYSASTAATKRFALSAPLSSNPTEGRSGLYAPVAAASRAARPSRRSYVLPSRHIA
jgi:hypothetical protein